MNTTNNISREQYNQLLSQLETLKTFNIDLNTIFNLSIPTCVIDKNFNVIRANNTFCAFFGITKEEVLQKKCYEIRKGPFCHTDKCTITQLSHGKDEYQYETELITPDNRKIAYQITAHPYLGPSGEFLGVVENFFDLSMHKQAEAALREIEWLIMKRPTSEDVEEESYLSPYGNLVLLNTCRVIYESVRAEILANIVDSYLKLLETSAAVYEVNGDYALGIFTSSWCRTLDSASRNLCNTDDNKEALRSGKWHCHESCWTNASKISIETKSLVDMECLGGIRIYAVPIWASGEVIGSINFGYGNPPEDIKKLEEIAERYGLSVVNLTELSKSYKSRPSFIIEVAKQRLSKYANQIGIMVENKRAENEIRTSFKREQFLYAAIKNSEKKFRTLFNNISDPILIYDLSGKFLEINQQVYEQLGYTREEFLKMSLHDITEDKIVEIFPDIIKHLIKHDHLLLETNFKRKDGRKLPFEISSRLIDYAGNQAILSIARDITERIKFETMQKEFITTASHQLRTPISVINQAITNLLKYKEKISPEQYNELLESISRNTIVLTELVEDLLLVSKYDEKKDLEFSFQSYNPLKLLQNILAELDIRRSAKNITIKIEFNEALQLFGDPRQINHLFRILIDNAIKFSDNNALIEIKAMDHYKGKYNPKETDGILIQISDTGRGIQEEDIPYLFQKFYRSRDVADIPGSGLGLYFAKEIALLHSGNIYIESIYGKGTSAFLFLPYLKGIKNKK
ncbi:MAG TPA: PAS domain S-box protein [Candidatus Deferrimicrobium sp.]|nr:PAS domain S-box protein [Candidatus Deferrimicrobium sp.]